MKFHNPFKKLYPTAKFKHIKHLFLKYRLIPIIHMLPTIKIKNDNSKEGDIASDGIKSYYLLYFIKDYNQFKLYKYIKK